MKSKLLKLLKDIIKKAYLLYTQSDLFTKAAALAYYTLFSLPPLLVIIVSVVSSFLDENSVRSSVFKELTRQLGYNNAQEIYDVMNRIGLVNIGFGPSLIGALVLLFLASTIFVTMRNGLNEIFNVNSSRSGIVQLLFSRAIAIAFILGFAFVLLATLLTNTFLTGLEAELSELFPETRFLFLEIMNWWLPIIGPISLFFVLFKLLPEITIDWKIASAGAVFTTILFFIGKRVISLYIANSTMINVFSATGSLVAILVWIYYTAFIFYLGAVFTAAIKNYFEVPDLSKEV